MNINFILNGEDVSLPARPMDRLVELLRGQLGQKHMMSDCKVGLCGKCLVLVNGLPAYACLIPAFSARGKEIITYEGFMNTAEYEKVDKAFMRSGVEPCSFCRPAYYLMMGYLMEQKYRPESKETTEYLSSIYCTCQASASILATAKEALEIKATGRKQHGR